MYCKSSTATLEQIVGKRRQTDQEKTTRIKHVQRAYVLRIKKFPRLKLAWLMFPTRIQQIIIHFCHVISLCMQAHEYVLNSLLDSFWLICRGSALLRSPATFHWRLNLHNTHLSLQSYSISSSCIQQCNAPSHYHVMSRSTAPSYNQATLRGTCTPSWQSDDRAVTFSVRSTVYHIMATLCDI